MVEDARYPGWEGIAKAVVWLTRKWRRVKDQAGIMLIIAHSPGHVGSPGPCAPTRGWRADRRRTLVGSPWRINALSIRLPFQQQLRASQNQCTAVRWWALSARGGRAPITGSGVRDRHGPPDGVTHGSLRVACGPAVRVARTRSPRLPIPCRRRYEQLSPLLWALRPCRPRCSRPSDIQHACRHPWYPHHVPPHPPALTPCPDIRAQLMAGIKTAMKVYSQL